LKKIFVIALILFVNVACEPDVTKIGSDNAKRFTESLTYTKDSKTNLCFAVVGSAKYNEAASGSMTITWVPCNKEVEEVIEQMSKRP
jgi:hypothetical protein